jgi:hypothetical protein
MSEVNFEEAHYYWVLSEVCDLIRDYGYTKVLMDIDKSLRNQDLEVTLKNTIPDTLEEDH